MDFFEHQDEARVQTRRLVILYIFAVLFIIVAVTLSIYGVLCLSGADNIQLIYEPQFWLWSALFTSAVISVGTLFRVLSLRKGGEAVAEMLGGRLISRDTQDFKEKQLVNIVDEMAIAAGIPSPPIYILEEDGINAFAAGYQPMKAVVGVSRGSITQLNREEMQGVVAHEFSHIFNGDMALNIKLMGILNGILLIGSTGFFLMRSSGRSGIVSRRSKGGGLQLALIGFALGVIGYIGVFFARLIKSAVSRQREFLADASAVQFTRNPSGIAGALVKIQLNSTEGRIEHRNAEQASHLFFSQALKMSSLMATHPPLSERIRRIDPRFIEAGLTSNPNSDSVENEYGVSQFSQQSPVESNSNKSLIESVGNPSDLQYTYAKELLAEIPESVKVWSHKPQGASILALALFMPPNTDFHKDAFDGLKQGLKQHQRDLLFDLVESLSPKLSRWRLPVFELLLPSLNQLTLVEKEDLLKQVRQLVWLDGRVSVCEFIYHYMLKTYLSPKQSRAIGNRKIAFQKKECQRVLALVAKVGNQSEADRLQSYKIGAELLELDDLRSAEIDNISLSEIEKSFSTLSLLAPLEKRKFVRACIQTAMYDQKLQVVEIEILRSVTLALGCPMPPFRQRASSNEL